jgi:hypothetical protein
MARHLTICQAEEDRSQSAATVPSTRWGITLLQSCAGGTHGHDRRLVAAVGCPYRQSTLQPARDRALHCSTGKSSRHRVASPRSCAMSIGALTHLRVTTGLPGSRGLGPVHEQPCCRLTSSSPGYPPLYQSTAPEFLCSNEPTSRGAIADSRPRRSGRRFRWLTFDGTGGLPRGGRRPAPIQSMDCAAEAYLHLR